jgi:hypothetical protein
MIATILTISIVLSVVVAISPGQQASAKQCRGSDNHDTSCRHDQDNSENHHDDSSKTRKDKIPFRLPFP